MAVLEINQHQRVNLLHIVNLIFGDRVDLHFVKNFNESSVRGLRSRLDDDDRFLKVFVLTYFLGFLIVFRLVDLTIAELLLEHLNLLEDIHIAFLDNLADAACLGHTGRIYLIAKELGFLKIIESGISLKGCRSFSIQRLAKEIIYFVHDLAIDRIGDHRANFSLGIEDDCYGVIGRGLAHILHIVHFLIRRQSYVERLRLDHGRTQHEECYKQHVHVDHRREIHADRHFLLVAFAFAATGILLNFCHFVILLL